MHLDPARLDFEYMRHIAGAVVAWRPPEKMLAIHLGGGICTLPRYLAHAYPDSRHIVAETDGALASFAREWWDLPRAPRMRIRVADALQVLQGRHADSADLIVRDAFAGDSTPSHLADAGFWQEAKRVVRPGGIVVANIAVRPRTHAPQADARAAANYFKSTCAVGDPGASGGKRIGNIVLIAGDRIPTDRLRAYAASTPVPTVVRASWGA